MDLSVIYWSVLKRSIALSIVAGLLVGSFVAIGIPRVLVLVDGLQEKSMDEQNLDELQAKLIRIQLLDDRVVDDVILVLLRVLPSEFDISRVVRAASDKAEMLGLEVQEYSGVVRLQEEGGGAAQAASGRSKSGKLKSQLFTFVAKGEWSQLASFFESIKRVAPAMRVMAVSLSREEDGLVAQMTIESYYMDSSLGSGIGMGNKRLVVPDSFPIELSEVNKDAWGEIKMYDYSVYE